MSDTEPMSDIADKQFPLRERIAEALYDHTKYLLPWGEAAYTIRTDFLKQADAIIDRLGFHADTVGTITRWVTDWAEEKRTTYCIRCGRPHGEGECLRRDPAGADPS